MRSLPGTSDQGPSKPCGDGKVNRIYIKLPDELFYILGGDDNVGLSDQFLESLLILYLLLIPVYELV